MLLRPLTSLLLVFLRVLIFNPFLSYFSAHFGGRLCYYCSVVDVGDVHGASIVATTLNAPAADNGDRNVTLSQLERLHTSKAVSLYIKSLERSRANELHGSDIYRFRTADIALAEAVKQKLA